MPTCSPAGICSRDAAEQPSESRAASGPNRDLVANYRGLIQCVPPVRGWISEGPFAATPAAMDVQWQCRWSGSAAVHVRRRGGAPVPCGNAGASGVVLFAGAGACNPSLTRRWQQQQQRQRQTTQVFVRRCCQQLLSPSCCVHHVPALRTSRLVVLARWSSTFLARST